MGASHRPIETAEFRAGFKAGLKEALRVISDVRANGLHVPQKIDIALMQLVFKGGARVEPETSKESDADRASKAK
jgi:hypothetical protein